MYVTANNLEFEAECERLARLGRKVRRRLNANKKLQRIATDGAEIWAVADFLDPVECGRLMLMIDETAKPSVTVDYEVEEGFRTSYSGDLFVFDPFVSKIRARIDDLVGINSSFGESVQGQRYTAGQYFKTHADWFGPKSPAYQAQKAHGGQRAFTAMAYLNDVPDGGETDFPQLDIAIKPRQGVLLVWNNMLENGMPNPRTAHAGNPVPSGFKYVITRWFRAQPWIP